jgi:hypothetical protein
VFDLITFPSTRRFEGFQFLGLYIALNYIMIKKQWTRGMWKHAIVVWFKEPLPHVPIGAEEWHEKCQESWSPHRDLNPAFPEYEAGLPTTRSLHSVFNVSTLQITCDMLAIWVRYINNIRAGTVQSVWRRAMDWTAGVRFSAEAREFFFLHTGQTGSGARPALYPMDTGGSFPQG